MANCCCTHYVVQSTKENISRLKETLLSVKDPENPRDMDPWAGYFLQAIGKDPNQVLDNCGWIPNYESAFSLSEDGTELSFWVESKWTRIECLESVIAEVFDATVWFMEEELGCHVFCTNDTEHTVFPQYVILDGNEYEMNYYTPEEARKEVADILKKENLLPEGYDKMTIEEIGEYVYGHLEDMWMHIAQTV